MIGERVFKTHYLINEAGIELKLPNDAWQLSQQGNGNYIFKRDPITDSDSREIIPAIMLYFEDASSYHEDVVAMCAAKLQNFKNEGVRVEKILVQTDDGYPLIMDNAVFVTTSYTQNEIDHFLWMVFLITPNQVGVQLYMDMTESLRQSYSNEFLKTLKGLRITN